MQKYILLAFIIMATFACKNETPATNTTGNSENSTPAVPAEATPAPLNDPKLEEMRLEGKKRLDMITQMMDEIDALPALARTDRDLQNMRNALANSLGKAQSSYEVLSLLTKEDQKDAAGTVINSAKSAEDALNGLKRYDAFFAEIRSKIDALKK
jgi:DNA repair ATPase RecN